MTTPRYLLDTNICIYIRRHRPAGVLSHFERLTAGEVAISVITWGELLFGVEKSDRRKEALQLAEELITQIPVLPVSIEVGHHYGQIRAALSARGEIIGNNDLWIAAHARALSLTLVTNNEREFRRVPDLNIVNWN